MSEIDKLEAELTQARIYELWFKPPPDVYDARVLRETHFHIFQDLPKFGLTDPPPGKFRDPIKTGDWFKARSLESLNGETFVVYSHMGSGDLAELDKVLKAAQPAKLKGLRPPEFAAEMAKLYAKLDYIHPFYEGNSRTLRAFTESLARASGYNLDWGRFNTSPRARDVLYIARDLAVGEQALHRCFFPNNAQRVAFTLDTYAGNPGLDKLMQGIVRPFRALAFEKMPSAEAIRQYPELKEAFTTLVAADKYFRGKMPGNEVAQAQAMQKTRDYIQSKLNAGEVSGFRRPASEKSVEKPPQQAAKTSLKVQEQDRER
jgi:cell filamentation protein